MVASIGLPGSYDALVNRRKGLEAWTELHAGFMGRAPDHVASCISGMYMGLEVFEAYDANRARALSDYYRYARDNDLYLTYVIINPQADRSKSAAQQADPFLTAGVVDRDADGITVRGAKMLATGGILANEVFVTCIQPLQPGDEKHAISFAVPMNAKGMKILSRKSYEAAPSVFDNPLSSRFDENDACFTSTTSKSRGTGCLSSITSRCARSSFTPRPPMSIRTTRRWSASRSNCDS
jgi:4-hydroxyphenylacetate 3-monooxygenase